MLSNLKNTDLTEEMIDPKKESETGFHSSANPLNNFFVPVFNASDNIFNHFSDKELNQIKISIERAKHSLKASIDGFSPNLVPVQLLRK